MSLAFRRCRGTSADQTAGSPAGAAHAGAHQCRCTVGPTARDLRQLAAAPRLPLRSVQRFGEFPGRVEPDEVVGFNLLADGEAHP
ncbi:hypothetical protein C7I55_04345 [Sphingomonas deserti]|uniref:Uncharacterized protein n=1 Tax=Allosphingosinicella deserti TaxID=2116704 RepID=A0A2P7QUB9_9SPHN|nr:hypothetical protein C7I55_04345 [Sphingomonas deserti]